MKTRTPVPRTATELLLLVENQLGWDPNEQATEKTPVWKVRAIMAGRLNRAIKKEDHVSLENLALALDYCIAEKKTITSPFGLVVMIRDALKWDREGEQPTVVTDLEGEYEAAIAAEQANGDDQSAAWLGRFMRAQGPSRHLLLQEWKEAGRG